MGILDWGGVGEWIGPSGTEWNAHGGNTHEQFGTQIKSQSGKEPEGMEIRREIRISLINIRSNCGGRGEAEL